MPAEHAIRGMHGVTLLLDKAEATGAILTGVLGLTETGREGSAIRYAGTAEGGDLRDAPGGGGLPPGRTGAGSVHHIAFRAADDAAQAAMAETLNGAVRACRHREAGPAVLPFGLLPEPGGVLFEIATDVPGFAVGRTRRGLGGALKLPAFLETAPRLDRAGPARRR